jgi:hypothetical protein
MLYLLLIRVCSICYCYYFCYYVVGFCDVSFIIIIHLYIYTLILSPRCRFLLFLFAFRSLLSCSIGDTVSYHLIVFILFLCCALGTLAVLSAPLEIDYRRRCLFLVLIFVAVVISWYRFISVVIMLFVLIYLLYLVDFLFLDAVANRRFCRRCLIGLLLICFFCFDEEMAVQPFFGFVYSLMWRWLSSRVLWIRLLVHWFVLFIGMLFIVFNMLANFVSINFFSHYFWDAVAKPRGDQYCLICLMDDTVSYQSFRILLLIVIFSWLQCMFFVLSDPCWYSFVSFILFMFSFFFSRCFF